MNGAEGVDRRKNFLYKKKAKKKRSSRSTVKYARIDRNWLRRRRNRGLGCGVHALLPLLLCIEIGSLCSFEDMRRAGLLELDVGKVDLLGERRNLLACAGLEGRSSVVDVIGTGRAARASRVGLHHWWRHCKGSSLSDKVLGGRWRRSHGRLTSLKVCLLLGELLLGDRELLTESVRLRLGRDETFLELGKLIEKRVLRWVLGGGALLLGSWAFGGGRHVDGCIGLLTLRKDLCTRIA